MKNHQRRPDRPGKRCPKVLMVGPKRSRKGGIASVINSYIENWDHNKYELVYIASVSDTFKLGKLIRFLLSILEFCYRSIMWRPEIVHIHFSWKASFMRKAIIAILARIFHSKLILHCHASRFDVYYDQNSWPVQQFIRQILNMSDLLLVVSHSWQAYFSSLELNTPVTVLYNSVTCPEGDFSSLDREPIILTLGRLDQNKGTYDILHAIPKVIASYPNTQFWLAGDGDVSEVKALVANQPWGRHLKLLGWIEGEMKDQVLRQGHIFLHPSYHEGLPVAIMEAMAYGLPVVSCSVGGVEELVIDQKTGFIVQSGDVESIVEKLLVLLGDTVLAQELGEAGRKKICENFNINALVNRLFDTYSLILERADH